MTVSDTFLSLTLLINMIIIIIPYYTFNSRLKSILFIKQYLCQNKRNQKFYELRNYQKLDNIFLPNQSEHPFYCYEKVLNV